MKNRYVLLLSATDRALFMHALSRTCLTGEAAMQLQLDALHERISNIEPVPDRIDTCPQCGRKGQP